jgi:adenylate kinase family enzyme
MPLIYITGVSGSGKSTVRAELSKRGYKVFGVDEDRIAAFYNNETGKITDNPRTVQDRSPEWYAHHTWKISRERVERLALQGENNLVFLCGDASNDEEVCDLFSRIVALTVDSATLEKRITTRTTNYFGKLPHEYASILEQQKRAGLYYRRLNAILIDATQPIEAVVDEILEKVPT